MTETSPKRSSFAILAAGLLRGGLPLRGRRRASEPAPEKPCIICGKPKRHNNAFCSVDCCREHKRRRQSQAVGVEGPGQPADP